MYFGEYQKKTGSVLKNHPLCTKRPPFVLKKNPRFVLRKPSLCTKKLPVLY